MRANTTCDYAKEVADFTIKLKRGNPSGSLACVGKSSLVLLKLFISGIERYRP